MDIRLLKPSRGALIPAAIAVCVLAPTVSFGDTVHGMETNVNASIVDVVNSTTDPWTNLVVWGFSVTENSRIVATACSDVANPKNSVANHYNFILQIDSPFGGHNAGGEKSIDELYDDPSEDDPEIVSICATRAFFNVPPGNHSIYWLASKSDGAMANAVVEDTVLTIVVIDD